MVDLSSIVTTAAAGLVVLSLGGFSRRLHALETELAGVRATVNVLTERIGWIQKHAEETQP